MLTVNDSSTPTSRPRSTPSATTQPKKTLNNDWRLNIQPLQRDNHLGAATPLASKTGSASKAKDKKLAKEKAKGAKGKARAVEESEDDDRDGALREKESGIEDEAVESFPGGTSGLDQVRESRLFTLLTLPTTSCISFRSTSSK